MKTPAAPALDSRESAELLSLLLLRAQAFVPTWNPPARTPGYGLSAIVARQVETVLQRLNQVPAKQKLAFLDLLGISLIPAQASRVPIVFQLSEQASSSSAPAGTAISAPPAPESSQPIIFETEAAAGIRAGKLVQVLTHWPGRDEYIDHSARFLAGLPVRAFARSLLTPVPHHLYLSHPVLLALQGPVQLGVEFELVQPSRDVLELTWEYWDGKVWRGFLSTQRTCQAPDSVSLDGTNGLTRGGTVTLKAECTASAKVKVDGREAYWIRARLNEPLAANADRQLPQVERVRISSTVNRSLRGSITRVIAHESNNTGFQRAQPQTRLFGRVLTEADQPVEGARVFLRSVEAGPTSSDGGYSLPPIEVAPGEEDDIRVVVGDIEFAGAKVALAGAGQIDIVLAMDGLLPDKAFADATTLDLSKPFYPMGQQPQPGTSFYFTSEEIFAKPGAKVSAFVSRTLSPQDEVNVKDAGGEQGKSLFHQTAWEYWNGRNWTELAVTSNRTGSKKDLDFTEIAGFTVPADFVPNKVNNEEARWIRVRLESGSYGFRKEVSFHDGGGKPNSFTFVVARPPVLSAIRLGYTWQFGPFHPETVVTYNDLRYEDHTYEAIWPGASFLPFQQPADSTPALYLGFEKRPPVDSLGIYLDIEERRGDTDGPALAWQYWNGAEWRDTSTDDQTGNLRRAGLVSVLSQPDETALARFGVPLYWLRARLKEDGPPGEPVITGIFPNAVWASQLQTLRDITVGTSDGTQSQAMAIPQTPILAGEVLEVRELSGARAAVEWRIVALELFGGDAVRLADFEKLANRTRPGEDVVLGPVRLRRDRRNHITEVWVRWDNAATLDETDRHYSLDQATGRLDFGDGINGRIPPVGATIMLRRMATGGGLQGNAPAGTVNQLLGAVPGVAAVYNPRAAEGGANTEPVSMIANRGPATVRHRGRPISASDYEAMAREASPAVAFARALPSRNPAGARLPGWVTLVIVPYGDEPRPYPSFGLREHVRRHMESRAPADLAAAHRIAVLGPDYFAVDVSATLAPIVASEAGVVEQRAIEAIRSFLHPLRGGPEGQGWPLGRSVFLSDIVSVVERVEGLDYIKEITLFRDGVPQGETVPIGEESIAVAGTVQLSVQAAER